MKKNLLVVLALLVLGLGTLAYIGSKKADTSESAPPQVAAPTPTPTPAKQLTWTDEAGFTFLYPEGTTIDNHPEDKKNYANLTLSLPTQEVIQILMSDNTYKDLDDWVGDNIAIDTTLEGRPAKKIIREGLETIACIDNEVIVEITGKDTSGIADSWAFIYPTTSPAKSAAPSADYDENVLEEE